jgi:FkbM family methyltransferase
VGGFPGELDPVAVLIPLATLVKENGVKPGPTLHVGAHIGEEAEAYDFFGFVPVWWIEANADLLPRLRLNLSMYPGQFIINALVSDSPKELTFHLASNGASSSYMELGTHATEHPDVTYVGARQMLATTVDLLHEEGSIGQASYMSMDVQGTELDVLRGAERYIEKVDAIYAEVNTNEVYKGCASFDEVTEWLRERGFTRRVVSMTDHFWGDCLYTR